MSLSRLIKSSARSALSKNWTKAVVITTLLVFLSFVFYLAETLTYLVLGIDGFVDSLLTIEKFSDDIINILPLAMIITGIFSLIIFLILTPLGLGITSWYYHLAKGDDAPITLVFSYFSGAKHYFRSLGLSLSLTIRRLFWSILFFSVPIAIIMWSTWILEYAPEQTLENLAGLVLIFMVIIIILLAIIYMIFMQRYFLASYLVVSDESNTLKISHAIKQSIFLTKSRRSALLTFNLSYLFWYLLTIFIVPMLFVVPYHQSSLAVYAAYLMMRYEHSIDKEFVQEQLDSQTKEFLPVQPTEEGTSHA